MHRCRGSWQAQPLQGILLPSGGKPPCIQRGIYLPSDVPLCWVTRGLFGPFCFQKMEWAAILSSYGAPRCLSLCLLQWDPWMSLPYLQGQWENLCCAPDSSLAKEVEAAAATGLPAQHSLHLLTLQSLFPMHKHCLGLSLKARQRCPTTKEFLLTEFANREDYDSQDHMCSRESGLGLDSGCCLFPFVGKAIHVAKV